MSRHLCSDVNRVILLDSLRHGWKLSLVVWGLSVGACQLGSGCTFQAWRLSAGARLCAFQARKPHVVDIIMPCIHWDKVPLSSITSYSFERYLAHPGTLTTMNHGILGKEEGGDLPFVNLRSFRHST
jgi:hypothetical protein